MVVDPAQGGPGLGLELVDEGLVAGPPFVLVQQDKKQGSGVGGAVVGRMRPLFEGGQFAGAQLVHDFARFRIAEVVDRLGLEHGQQPEGRLGEVGSERQGLVAGDKAVPTEEAHEPRQPGRRDDRPRGGIGGQAEGGEIDHAAPVGLLDGEPVRGDAGGFVEPAGKIVTAVLGAPMVADAGIGTGGDPTLNVEGDGDGDIGLPLIMRLQVGLELYAVVGDDLVVVAGGDRGLAHVTVPSVSEHQSIVVTVSIEIPGLGQLVFDFEQVGEVGIDVDPKRQRYGLGVVIEDGEMIDEPVFDRPLSDDRNRGIVAD